jgi:hypothetical protein
MDPGGAPGFTGPGGSAWVRGSMGAIWDYIAKIVSMVIELPRSTQLNILYFIATDYNTLILSCFLSVYVKSPYRTPRDYITLVSRPTMSRLTVEGDIITRGTVGALDVNSRRVARVNVL